VVRGVARYRERRLNIRQLLLEDDGTAQRLECFRMLGGDATVESTGKSCWKVWIRCRNYLQLGGNMWLKLKLT